MEVFVANPSLSHREFNYRVAEIPTIRILRIAPHRQAKFPEDFADEQQLAYLIDQLERAGGVPANDPRSLTHPHSLIYTVSRKPIEAKQIETAVERDAAAIQERASVKTEEAGLSTFGTLAKPNPDSLRSASLEVTELKSTPGSEEVAKGGVNYQARVDRTAPRKSRRG